MEETKKTGRPYGPLSEESKKKSAITKQQNRLAKAFARAQAEIPPAIISPIRTSKKLSVGGMDTPGLIREGRYHFEFRSKNRICELSPEAIEVIADLMRHSTNDFCRLAAAKDLLDRGLGKARENVHIQQDNYLNTINVKSITPELQDKMTAVIDELEQRLPKTIE